MKYQKPEIEIIDALSNEFCLEVTASSGGNNTTGGFDLNQGSVNDSLED